MCFRNKVVIIEPIVNWKNLHVVGVHRTKEMDIVIPKISHIYLVIYAQ